MTKNKLTYLLPAALALHLVACVHTYPGLTEDMSGTHIVDSIGMNDTVMAHEEFKLISVAISDPSYSTVISDTNAGTRSLGGFDLMRPDSIRRMMWDSARFYLYAFQDRENIDFSVTRKNDSVNCLLDNEPTWMADPNGFVLSYVVDKEHDGHNWWNNKLPNAPYRFWGYYTDDVEVLSQERTSDHIGMTFNIDGSQDILSGYAELTQKQQERMRQDTALQAFYGQYYFQDRPWENLYSTTTARRDILPIIQLKHHLARFKFQVYPGNAASDSMIIDSIKVLSRTQGNLVIASNANSSLGCTFAPTPTAWLQLHDHDNYPTLHEGAYVNRWKEEYDATLLYHRGHLDLGEGMMLPPSDSLRIQLFARQHTTKKVQVPDTIQVRDSILVDSAFHYFDTIRIEHHTEVRDTMVDPFQHINGGNIVNLHYAKGFKAGMLYTIRIALYGEEPFDVTVVLSGWEKKEDVVVNPEDENFRPY